MVEVARLESVYMLLAYRGFESLPLRQNIFAEHRLCEAKSKQPATLLGCFFVSTATGTIANTAI